MKARSTVALLVALSVSHAVEAQRVAAAPPPAPTLTVGFDLAADVTPPADEELVGLAVVVAGEHAGWTACTGHIGAPEKSLAATAEDVPKVGIGVDGPSPAAHGQSPAPTRRLLVARLADPPGVFSERSLSEHLQESSRGSISGRAAAVDDPAVQGGTVAYYAVSLSAPPAAAPGASRGTINNSRSNSFRISLPQGSGDVEIASASAAAAPGARITTINASKSNTFRISLPQGSGDVEIASASPAAAPGARITTINNSKSNTFRISPPQGSVDVEIVTDLSRAASWPPSRLVVAAQVVRARGRSTSVVLAPAQCASAPPP